MSQMTTAVGMSRHERHLLVAIEAVRLGGDLLLSCFGADGRRPSRDVHELDCAAEDTICRHLAAAFPTYGMGAEERAEHRYASSDAEHHVWVVDPLDGSTHYEQGRRGPAASVALLRDGHLVLGVVLAFAAGGPGGDLFTWVEGGPVRRNGQVVVRRWDERLTPSHTVLFGDSASDHIARYAMMASPARFRALPSIAYRLALVAAGEGDVAVSHNGPVGHDYAAGHALLIGAGAELYDDRGRPVVYGRDGTSNCGGSCFGGAKGQVEQVRSGGSKKPTTLQVDRRHGPCRPRRLVADLGLLSRAWGCLLGQCAGDSLGSLVEFKSAASIETHHRGGPRLLLDGGTWSTLAGQPTDDTELALALARSIVERGGHDERAVAAAYASWLSSSPFDVGTTTRQALAPARSAVKAGGDPAAAARESASRSSPSNGGLMRISPLGIFGHAMAPEKLAEFARTDTSLTHPSQVCVDASVAFTAALAEAVRGGAAVAAHGAALEACRREKLCGKVHNAIELAASSPPPDYERDMGHVLIALQNAFHQLLHAPSAAEGVIDTVRRGGDTDTNGAIAGALLGAVHGALAWPTQWRDRVLSCRPIEGLDGVDQARPAVYWPTDVLELAEALLVAGQVSG